MLFDPCGPFIPCGPFWLACVKCEQSICSCILDSKALLVVRAHIMSMPRHNCCRCIALEQTRLQELWLQRPSALGYASYLLGTPSNILASGAQDWFPEWHLQYRIARDSLAYSREEFKKHYGCKRFRAYWDEAVEATEAQKHVALLFVLRSHCDQHRMRKVAAAFRNHTRFDDAIIENIASFVGLRAQPIDCGDHPDELIPSDKRKGSNAALDYWVRRQDSTTKKTKLQSYTESKKHIMCFELHCHQDDWRLHIPTLMGTLPKSILISANKMPPHLRLIARKKYQIHIAFGGRGFQ